MRPLSLTFTAFGSYPGTEHIDFTALSGLGLYVVTGPTGSGKTTVFDAMTYALYGVVPGDRDPGDIRSHHAPDNAICEVTLRFEVEGITYRVTRTPEQSRPSTRAADGFVKKAASAALIRESDEVALASRAGTASKSGDAAASGKVSDACVELVGLDAEQFQRVVLLPQGKFQQFLLADTRERLPLLRQLFDSGRWLAVTDRLKARAAEAKAEVASIEALLGNHRHGVITNLQIAADYVGLDSPILTDVELAAAATLDEFAGLHAQFESIATIRRAAALAAAQSATLATEAQTAAQRVLDDWTTRHDLTIALAALEERSASVDILRARLLADAAAQPVANAMRTLASAEAGAAATESALVAARTAVVEAGVLAGIDIPDTPELLGASIASARNRISAERSSFDAVLASTASLDTIGGSITAAALERDAIAARLDAIATDLDAHRARLLELADSADSIPECEKQVALAADRLRDATRAAELQRQIDTASAHLAERADAQHELTRRFIAGAAPRLAATLVEGHACPVCGSADHPHPASPGDAAPVDAAELERAGRSVTEAAAALEARTTERQLLCIALGADVDRSLPELEALLHDAEAVLTAARAALAERSTRTADIDAIEADRVLRVARSTALELDLARLTTERSGAEAALASALVGLGELAERWNTEGAALAEVFAAGERALDHLETTTTTWIARLAEHGTARGALGNARSSFDDALAASRLPDTTAVEAALIAPPERTQHETTIAAFDTDLVGTRARLAELAALDLPVDRPDITALQLEAEQTREAAQLAADESSRLDERLRQVADDLGEARHVEAEAGGAFVHAAQLSALSETCQGRGPRKVAIETWVLAGELDRVALAASIHLERMTAGRYRLERSDTAVDGRSQGGLDLRVLDAHTGVGRRPASLSGGEQFQASLALALGLADVVSQGGSGSGRVFESLFVDEGFGSLDPESLGQAVDALHQIHAMGRTVGVITHVEAMKDDLITGIRVDRLGDGRGSTLTCHPEI